MTNRRVVGFRFDLYFNSCAVDFPVWRCFWCRGCVGAGGSIATPGPGARWVAEVYDGGDGSDRGRSGSRGRGFVDGTGQWTVGMRALKREKDNGRVIEV